MPKYRYARRITSAFASAALTMNEGDIVVADRPLPNVILQNSEDYDGVLPVNLEPFNFETYARDLAPRPEPTKVDWLDASAVRARFKVNTDAARRFGLKPDGAIDRLREDGVHRQPMWSADTVAAWLSDVRAAIGGAR